MALNLRRLAVLYSKNKRTQDYLSVCNLSTKSGKSVSTNNQNDVKEVIFGCQVFVKMSKWFSTLAFTSLEVESHLDFKKWHNGGGAFHPSACIDSTALIEIGAIVHPDAVLGANVRIGSRTVVGPAVTIGQSTKIGYIC